MDLKQTLAAGAAVVAFVGAGIGVRNVGDEGVAFVSPLELSQSVCGRDASAMRERRGYFLTMAAALATAIEEGASDAPDAPLVSEGIAFDVTTNSIDAQGYFNEGLAHMWNFNHGAAVDAFKKAQAADPSCAMCFWGEAIALGPNINAPMEDAAVEPASAAIAAAVKLKDAASEKEQNLIDAASARYAKPLAMMERFPLDAAFADEMDALAEKYQDDDFILSLAAEANMDTQPWDYWEADGRTPKGRSGRTLELLETVLDRNPDHIAAIHLYIHTTEATNNPYRAAPFADRLAELAPGLGHLQHMPSHIYYRIGRFKESIDVNVLASASDEAFIARGGASPFYEFGYYVHNVHFLMASALMAGDGETTLEMARKLDAKLPAEMAIAVPFAQPIKAAPYFAFSTFSDPEEVLALPDPSDGAPFITAHWHYARGEALARLGRIDAARAEADAISAISYANAFEGLATVNIPGNDILKIAELTVRSRVAAADGDLDAAIAAIEEAVDVQAGLRYTEPPFWYYPLKQTLAGLVLRKGDAERAEQLFLETLVDAPNSGWAYYGLGEAFAAQGSKNGRKLAKELFEKAWFGDEAPDLTRL